MSVPPGALLRVLRFILMWLPVLIELVAQVLAIWAAFRAAHEAAFPKTNKPNHTPTQPILLKWSPHSS